MGTQWLGRRAGLALVAFVFAACSSSADNGLHPSVPVSTRTPATSTTTSTTTTSTTTTSTTTASPTTTNPEPASTAETTTTAAPDPDPYAQPGWVARENALGGTTDWRIQNDSRTPLVDQPNGWIEGYADATSVQAGHDVTLFVDTPAATFTVSAYRMGWYAGAQSRLIWTSPTTAGGRQLLATFTRDTGTAEAPWHPSLSFTIGYEWPPGQYLLKLVSDQGGAHYVPLTIRDDHAFGQLLVVSAVTTWQAYNPWGGCTMYQCAPDRRHDRAQVVSFNRPYSHQYRQGSADFLDHELPLDSFLEQLGLDSSYVTDIDLHQTPDIAHGRQAIITLGHDEYYSSAMRSVLEGAVANGVNVAFLGANAVYRSIRLEPDASGRADRRMVNYRDQFDPVAQADPQQSTNQWRNVPLRRPEARLIGIQYACSGVHGAMRLVNTSNWVFAGTGATDGQTIDSIVGIEFDALGLPAVTPPNLELLAASPLTCHGRRYQHAMSYYTSASGAGVFATGTIGWVCALDGSCGSAPSSPVVRGVTENVLRAFAAGPTGVDHPSVGNVDLYRH